MAWYEWLFWLGLVLPVVVLLVLGLVAVVFGKRWVARFVEPDPEELTQAFAAAKTANPNAANRELIEPVVRKQALKCGIAGAITGFGGFVTLPLTLPIDMLLTARYQANMVSFIARAYGFESSVENRAATYAVMTGSTHLSRMTGAIVRKYAPQVLGKSLSKLIPVLGAAISFGVNYALARSMARAASSWYENKSAGQLTGQLDDQGAARDNRRIPDIEDS